MNILLHRMSQKYNSQLRGQGSKPGKVKLPHDLLADTPKTSWFFISFNIADIFLTLEHHNGREVNFIMKVTGFFGVAFIQGVHSLLLVSCGLAGLADVPGFSRVDWDERVEWKWKFYSLNCFACCIILSVLDTVFETKVVANKSEKIFRNL